TRRRLAHAPGRRMVVTTAVPSSPTKANGGTVPRGAGFVREVRELAELAGVDALATRALAAAQRRADLPRFLRRLAFELVGEGGVLARAYLERSSFPAEARPA